MRVGSIVYATDQGLGILAKSFVDHGVVTDVMVVRHGRRPEHFDWYPQAPIIGNLHGRADHMLMCEFCSDMDVMLFFETAFNWSLIDFCRKRGVKTALCVMHECTPRELPATPDLLLCPSKLDLEQMQRCFPSMPSMYLPVPVPDDVRNQWRLRERAKVFVHNAGWGGLKGRNGTSEVVEAWNHVVSPVELVVRHQGHGYDQMKRNYQGGRLEIRYSDLPYAELFSIGDVFLFPEKFNGLSLPLQEARAVGMLVMGSDRFPMNDWLPREPLIPVRRTQRACVAPRCLEFDEAVIDPQGIAARIDEWYERDISEYSRAGKAWAESMSWAKLGPEYRKVLEAM